MAEAGLRRPYPLGKGSQAGVGGSACFRRQANPRAQVVVFVSQTQVIVTAQRGVSEPSLQEAGPGLRASEELTEADFGSRSQACQALLFAQGLLLSQNRLLFIVFVSFT